MKVALQGNWLPLAALIRIFTFSRWHHAAIVDGDNAIESRALKGVVVTPLDEFKKRGNTRFFEVKLPDDKEAIAWAYGQVGKNYDWFSLLRFMFQRNWHKDEKWYCSELVAVAAEKGGRQLFNKDARGVLPRDIAMLPDSNF